MYRKRLSRASVLRLELYLEALEGFVKQGRECASSSEIAEVVGLSPESVRQDLLGLGADGRPKVGYVTSHLAHLIRELFDLNRPKTGCLVGFGNLGRALAGSDVWARGGYRLAAIFDNDPAVIGGEFEGSRVRSITELYGAIKAEGIQMGVVTVPGAQAQQTADLLVSAGVKAIWNFAPVTLSVPDPVVVENQFLAWGLITLSYRAAAASRSAGESQAPESR